jgi:colanic acid biosynthesis glycosyl transferase WcaI
VKRPRLLVLTLFYAPEPNFITADVAQTLANDFDVTVITPHPNYGENWFYPGTRGWWRPRRSSERGVTVWRLPMVPYHGRSRVMRAVSYLSFTAGAVLLAPLLCRGPRVVWVYHAPFFPGLAAIWFKLVRRARLVYTCADLWPESLLATGVAEQGPAMRAMFAYSRFINRWADVLICSTRGTAERFLRDGIPADRLRHLPVWVEGSHHASATEVRCPQVPPFRIVYAGNMGPAQPLEAVVRAAAELRRENLPVVFDFYGSGSNEEQLRALAARIGADNVRFHGRVCSKRAFEVSAEAFAQVVSLEPSPLFAMTVPSKLAFAFAAGAPVLYGLTGEADALAAESGGGIAYGANDAETFAAAVRTLLAAGFETRQEMSRRLRLYYEQHFERSKLLEQYVSIMNSEAGNRTGAQ